MKRILFAFLFCGSISLACNCPQLPAYNKDYCDFYDVIFQGKIDSVTPCNEKSLAWFSVKFLFKGKAFLKTSIQFDCSSDCMMNFSKGGEWIIYAKYFSYGNLETNFCSRSRKYISEKNKGYYAETTGISFKEELRLLTDFFGWKEISENKNQEISFNHVNIQPSVAGKIILIIASMLTLIFFYFLANKFWKN